MFLSDTMLKAFDPPSTSKIYDARPAVDGVDSSLAEAGTATPRRLVRAAPAACVVVDTSRAEAAAVRAAQRSHPA
jgi:hypothetical protein